MSEQASRGLEWRKAMVKELHDTAKPTVIKAPFGNLTMRQYTVTLHEQNTEYIAALEMLAEIHRWFRVEPKEPDQ